MQIGSALGSTLGQLVRVPESRMRLLVACGAAGGIAATFNAPLAGVFFAMELILGDFAAQSFGMVVLASVTASVIGRAALGDHPFLTLPAFTVHHVGAVPAASPLLGLLAGGVGVGFTRVLYSIEDAVRLAVARPGVAAPGRRRAAAGRPAAGPAADVRRRLPGAGQGGRRRVRRSAFLLVLLVGKMLATSLTIGIGGSGGVFAPSLFIGAMLGVRVRQAAARSSHPGSPARPAPTRWSAWARCSPARPAPRSPPSSSCSS